MPLSTAQKEMLDKVQIPEKLQGSIAQALGPEGKPKGDHERDFLQVLSDELLDAENRLYAKRQELAFELEKVKAFVDKPKQIATLEETIKDYWTTAAALWRAADLVVNQPEEGFQVIVTAQHAEYALQQKNLPVVELIRWAKPELFTLPVVYPALRQLSSAIAGLGGAFLGLGGGGIGGFRYGLLRQTGVMRIAAFGYAFVGVFMGWAVGGVMGARMGYQTGHPLIASWFGGVSAYLNPFNQPRGTQSRHATELKMQEIIFKLTKQTTKIS